MRIFILITVLFVFGCKAKSGQEKKTEEASGKDTCFVYPRVIDSLQVKDLYDSARWYVYTWNCDRPYLSKQDTSRSVTFGELSLRFSNVILRTDTLEIIFDFIDDHENYPILPSMTKNAIQLLSGVGFDIKKRKKIYMLSPSGFSTIIKGGTNRYENPVQPEVVNYIKNNINKLDICFKMLAQKEGILK